MSDSSVVVFAGVAGPFAVVLSTAGAARDRRETSRVLAALHADARAGDARELLAVYRALRDDTPAAPLPLGDLDAVADELGAAVERGELLLVPALRTSVRPEKGAADRLVERLMAGRRHLSVGGHDHRLIVAADWPTLPDRDDYRVLPAAEASQVLQRLGAAPGTPREVAAAAGEALPLLTDTRFQRPDDKLYLLRRAPRGAARAELDLPPVTPSRLLRDQPKEGWIEVHLVGEDDRPWSGPYRIQLADGQILEGRSGEDGVVRLERITEGNTSFTVVGVDGRAWTVG